MILWKKIVAVRPEIQYYGFDIRTGNGIGRGIRLTHCMADSGNVVITPDGSLYSCEHCSQESRFGIFRDDKMGGGGTGSQSTHYVFLREFFQMWNLQKRICS